MEHREAFIDKNPKTYDYSKVLNQGQAFFIRSRKIHFRGYFVFLGNDGILEHFALNARILGAELDYCDLKHVSRASPNAATKIRTLEK